MFAHDCTRYHIVARMSNYKCVYVTQRLTGRRKKQARSTQLASVSISRFAGALSLSINCNAVYVVIICDCNINDMVNNKKNFFFAD
jgi:hypothetical protein